jgi:sugar phosphate permease
MRTLAHREISMAQPGTPATLSDRRWVILSVVAVAQLMVVLDATIVNIALPSAQRALGFPDSDRQWVVTAYALAFGSLLLVGGRLGDMYDRKWVFITGLAGFAISSAVGGAAVSFGMLVAARHILRQSYRSSRRTRPLPAGPHPSIREETACPASPRPSRPTTCHAS